MRPLSTALLLLCAGIAAAQFGEPLAPERLGTEPEVELTPRYRIEFIVFAHNRFDATEEYFDVIPAGSQFADAGVAAQRRPFGAEERAELRNLIEAPISPPPRTAPRDDGLEAIVVNPQRVPLDPAVVLRGRVDPRTLPGPNTRYLEADELALLDEFGRIESLDAYTPLVHGGWEQNGLPEEEAVPIDMSEFGSVNPRGTIRLHMSRYLHISADLAYRHGLPPLAANAANRFADSPLPAQAAPAPANSPGRSGVYGERAFPAPQSAPEYYLFEQRRILRGELNYFDHPAFGLLLQITLAPEPQTDPQDEADGPSA